MSDKIFEFFIESKPDSYGIAVEEIEFDFILDSVVGVFNIITSILYANDIRFVLKINGKNYPTFDTEFAIFLECFSGVLDFSYGSNLQVYNFDFYEQGINYSFKFRKLDAIYYVLKFNDGKNPEIQIVRGRFHELRFLSQRFFDDFIFLSNKYCTNITNNELFVDWKAEMSSKLLPNDF